MTFKFTLMFSVIVSTIALYADVAVAAQRVLLIGDETVVDAATQSYGVVSELRRILAEEEKDVEVVPLGVRRSTFGDWRALVAKSYEENVPTDVEGVALKAELDKGADVVFVCLGRNDAFKPTFDGSFRETDVYSFNVAPGDVAALRDDISGLVEDLKKRTPGVKRVLLVTPYHECRRDSTAGMFRMIVHVVDSAASKTGYETLSLNDLFESAQRAAWFAADQIDLVSDDFRPNEFGSQLATWAFLLALSDKKFDAAYRSAQTLYAPAARPRVAAPYGTLPPDALQNNERKNDAPLPELDEWERVARRYYEARVDSRLRDAESPGFFLSPQYRVLDAAAREQLAFLAGRSKRDYVEEDFFPEDEFAPNKKILATVLCMTRGIEADQPLTRPDKSPVPPRGTSSRDGLDKTPKIEVVSCGSLRFDRIDEKQSRPEYYVLQFNGTQADLPVDITIRVGGIEKTARLERETEYFVSDIDYLREPFSSLEDFPQDKTITSVDYAALAGKDPVEFARTSFDAERFDRENAELARKGLAKRPPVGALWRTRLQGTSRWSLSKSSNETVPDADPDFVDLTRYCRNETYAGAYVVRYVDVDEARPATLKLGVKGYKTHVVERVYLNGKQIFFGELDVDDPEKHEASIPVQLKKGRNIMVARVDHTEWDWIVGFKFL